MITSVTCSIKWIFYLEILTNSKKYVCKYSRSVIDNTFNENVILIWMYSFLFSQFSYCILLPFIQFITGVNSITTTSIVTNCRLSIELKI